MKKLAVLVAVILIAGLLAGCWVLPESKLDYIEVNPEEVTLDIGGPAISLTETTEQLEVTAYYEDLTYADVTSNCEYSSSNTEVVTVNDEGLIVAVDPEGPTLTNIGGATILVSYTQHNFWTGRIIRICEVDVKVKY